MMMTPPATTVSQAMASRRSIRAFTDQPVDAALLRGILETAQLSPLAAMCSRGW